MSRNEAMGYVRVGTVGVIAPVYELPNGRLVARSLDNRIGAYAVVDALRLMATALNLKWLLW